MCGGSKPKPSKEQKELEKFQLEEMRARRAATREAERVANKERRIERDSAVRDQVARERGLGMRTLISGMGGGVGFKGRKVLNREMPGKVAPGRRGVSLITPLT